MMEDRLYKIGEVAKIIKCNITMIRYYDEINLVKPVVVSSKGYRMYSIKEIEQLQLIKTLKYLSFSIDEIRRIQLNQLNLSDAIDWKLSMMYTQIDKIEKSIDVLNYIRKNNQQKDSLILICDILDNLNWSLEERKTFIIHELEPLSFTAKTPESWKKTFTENSLKCLASEETISVEQAYGWTKLKKLVKDPKFASEYNLAWTGFWLNISSHIKATWFDERFQHLCQLASEAASYQLPIESSLGQHLASEYAEFFSYVVNTEVSRDFVARYLLNEYESDHHCADKLTEFEESLSLIDPITRKNEFIGHRYILQALSWKVENWNDY